MSNKPKVGRDGIYDARQLGTPKMLVLGFQHMFAMFGATVTVPLLTGLSISTTLLFAGLGTLLFHCLTKFKVPAFLGSSFAFLGGYAAVAPMAKDGTANKEMLPYACLGVACAGLIYLILAALIKAVGINKIMKLFPPVVTDYHCYRFRSCTVSSKQLYEKLVACRYSTRSCYYLQHFR